MKKSCRKVDRELLLEVTKVLTKRFPLKFNLVQADYLSESDRRNVLIRITLSINSSKPHLEKFPKSIIVKQSLPEEKDKDDKNAFARFARDCASLEFLNSIPSLKHIVPEFYGKCKHNRFLLIEDFGKHHLSLVDSLTLHDKDKAIKALKRFMKTLGIFHAASFDQVQNYQKLLLEINPEVANWENDIISAVNKLLKNFEYIQELLEIRLTSELIQEIQTVITVMIKPGPFTVLIHGDICPDNVFDHEEKDKLQLIDFELASVRNALLDGTYLRMHMPTCWCAKAIPSDVIEPLEKVYREELKKVIPTANDNDTYNTAYTYACGYWMLRSLYWLEEIWDKEDVWPSGPVPKNSLWKLEENFVRPRFLSRLSSFIEIAIKHDKLPHLRQMAMLILTLAQKRWPKTQMLALYPAFNKIFNEEVFP